MRTPKRDHLVDTAEKLFGREGFKSVSVDRLLKEAGVAKMTLYKGFKSKDELILETLRRRDTLLRNWFMREVESATDDPVQRLLACFDALEKWTAPSSFNGCYFVSALTEYSNEREAIHRAAREHKRMMLDYIVILCRDAELSEPEVLAHDLRLLMEGATVAKLTLSQPDSFVRAKRMARLTIESVDG